MHGNNLIRSLGYAGLLPFLIILSVVWLLQNRLADLAPQAFLLYSLAILCFLAGTVWGRAQTTVHPLARHLLVSNILVLFAVESVFVVADWIALISLTFGFLTLLWYEMRDVLIPSWYIAMRIKLTLGVVLSHALLLVWLWDQVAT